MTRGDGGPMHDRAQTNLDFAIGVSIMLVTIIAAMTFVPGLFSSVDQGQADADEVASTRMASLLVEEKLGHESQPGKIDTDCTRAFFSASSPENNYCGLDGDQPEDNLRLTDRTSLNVTVLNATGDRVCWDDSEGMLTNETEALNCDINLATGGTAAGGTDVAVTRRAVMIDEYDATLVVRAW